jgi:hypothetical protein
MAMRIIVALAGILLLGTTALFAQEWREVPLSYTNSQGYRITGFTAQATGVGCVGSQNYVKVGAPSDKGVSERRWTRATKQHGGILCSGGTWYYGGGQNAGKPGGSVPDLLIKDGKFYWRG